jgi:hypothetical protein
LRYEGNYSIPYIVYIVFLYVLYVFGFPVAVALAAPYILIWPRSGGAYGGGQRGRITANYLSLVRLWESIGYRLPVLK